MLHIAICDDDTEQLALIHSALLTYFAQRGEKAEIEDFSSSVLFLENLNHTSGYDIALLDICMPDVLGTGVAKEIRHRRDKTEIIFLTTSGEYAVDAFALRAAHYLMKPFTQDQFNDAMNRAMARFLNITEKIIAVKLVGGGVSMVNISEILYIESQGHLLTVYTKNSCVTENKRTLGRFLEELENLSPRQFITPYKGFIVNQKAIQTIEKDQIVLYSGHSIPIPRRGFKEIQNTYFDYMFSEERGK